MSIIMKSDKVAVAKQKKQAYTWAACIMIAFFVIATAIPLLSGGESSSEDYRARAYDLAQLPFTNDAAEQALLALDEYKDIPKDDLINSLYSKKDKEDRQLEDKVNGTPPPPDEEYKVAAVQKERQIARAAARRQAAAPKAPVTPTRVGSLSRGSSLTGGGGGSGVTANIWRSDDKGNRSGGTSVTTKERNQMLAKLGATGRATGFTDAALKSGAAANAKDAEGAAAGAIDAFAKGLDEKDADLTTELEKDAAELELNADAIGSKELTSNDLAAVDDAVNKLDQQKQENDQKEIKAFDWAALAVQLLGGLKDIALAKATAGKDPTIWTDAAGAKYQYTGSGNKGTLSVWNNGSWDVVNAGKTSGFPKDMQGILQEKGIMKAPK